jgi:holliday junction DNA helicase RuvA
MENAEIAARLREEAHRLARVGENLFRVRAYRWAAIVIDRLEQPVTELLDREGRAGLEAVPGIGRRLAKTLEWFVRTGEWVTRSTPRRIDPPAAKAG